MKFLVNMSYKLNAYDKLILSYKISLYLSNSFIEIENNDFNFDKFIKDYKIISH